MMRLPLSSAASSLLRALARRAEVPRDRILLIEWASTDWQSLTFVGERHRIALRICGPAANDACRRLIDDIEEADFVLVGHVLAEIAVMEPPAPSDDGSVVLTIEALTIAE